VRRTVLLCIAMVVVFIMASGVALAAPRILITGLRCDAPGNDHQNLNAEYVVVKNFSNKSLSLAGWKLYDRGKIHLYTFPAGFKLAPKAQGPKSIVWVHTGKGTQKLGKRHWDLYWGQGSAVWNNPPAGDTATLRTRTGVLVDTSPCTGQQQASRAPSPGGTYVTVTRVVDGDTIEIAPTVRGATDVRLIGVDAPEVYGGEETCGPEASDFTTRHLEGERVRLELDEDPFDQYDRLLAYVWLDGQMFNETLLESGLASQVTYQPNDKYEGRLIAAEARAKTPSCATSGATASPTAPRPAQGLRRALPLMPAPTRAVVEMRA
jgi:endonuclease YncB( thermonuclease family)